MWPVESHRACRWDRCVPGPLSFPHRPPTPTLLSSPPLTQSIVLWSRVCWLFTERKETQHHPGAPFTNPGQVEWHPPRSTARSQCRLLPSLCHQASRAAWWARFRSPSRQQEWLNLPSVARNTRLSLSLLAFLHEPHSGAPTHLSQQPRGGVKESISSVCGRPPARLLPALRRWKCRERPTFGFLV